MWTLEFVAFVRHHFYVDNLMWLLLSTKCNNCTFISTGKFVGFLEERSSKDSGVVDTDQRFVSLSLLTDNV